MSYQDIDDLTSDPTFNGRVRACALEQAEGFKDAADPAYVALAGDQFRGGTTYLAFVRLAAASPGIATGGNQSQVTDAELLPIVQNGWPTVAALYYDPEGNPIP
jgi:hypothetical protein